MKQSREVGQEDEEANSRWEEEANLGGENWIKERRGKKGYKIYEEGS